MVVTPPFACFHDLPVRRVYVNESTSVDCVEFIDDAREHLVVMATNTQV